MKQRGIIFIGSVLVFTASISFKKIEDKPLFAVPNNFPKPAYNFESNPLTKEGIELGKTLFYDAIISRDNSISCGSCHQQSAGFTQHGHALSHGVNDEFTKRNSMPLQNLAWANSFGWDGGVHDLDLFAVSPITNPVEMDESLANVLEKLRKTPTYPALFKKAFGSDEITTEKFLKALSQFMLTMVSANSRYDKFTRREGIALLPFEQEGLKIFKAKCASCHSGELFTDLSFRNNGLKNSPDDFGRFDVTQNENDKYKFKVPSLRNLSYTAPYMHDGRFETLAEVLDHYASGVEKSEFLDPILSQNNQLGIPLTGDEKQKLLAFLRTLNDETFLKDKRFSEVGGTTSQAINAAVPTIVDLRIENASLKKSFAAAINAYLKVKDAMLARNGSMASEVSEEIFTAFNTIDKSLMNQAQKDFFEKVYDNIAFDAEHIIETKSFYLHQADHFNELSKNYNSLINSFKLNSQPMYFCECENPKKIWLSNKPNELAGNKDCPNPKILIIK